MNKRGFVVIIALLAVFLINNVSALNVSLEAPDDNYADDDGVIDNLRWSATNTSENIDNWTLYFVETYSSQKNVDNLVANVTSNSGVELFNTLNNNWSISDFQSSFSLSYEGDSYVHWAVYLCNNNSECIWSDTRTVLNNHTIPVINIKNVSYSTNNVVVNYSIFDHTINSCSLVVNDEIKDTTNTGLNFNDDFIFSRLLSNGNYKLRVDCADKVGLTGSSENFTIDVSCSESWSCSDWDDWSSCDDGERTRTKTCTDGNSCGTTASKPDLSEDGECSSTTSSTNAGTDSTTSTTSVEEIGSSVTFSGDAGDKKRYSFSDDVGLTGMDIKLRTAVAGGSIDVEKISKPSDVSAPNGIVYTYVRIDKVDITDDNIDEALLKFRIGKPWLNEHIGDVVLKRYNNGWKDLPTLKASDDDNYAYYEAISPGFSVFAIAISGEESVTLASKTENKTSGNETKKGLITGFFGKDIPGALTGWIKDVNKYVWIVGIPFVVLLIVGVVYRERVFSRAGKEEREFDRHLKERAKLKEREEKDREKRLKVEQEIREEKERMQKEGLYNMFADKKGFKVKEQPKAEIKKDEKVEPKVEIVHEEKKGFFGFFKGKVDSFKERREEKERRFEFKDIKK